MEAAKLMAMPLRLTVKLGTYLIGRRSKSVSKHPLIMELEPLRAGNLSCAGSGKIRHLPLPRAAVARGAPPARGAGHEH